MPIHGPKTAQVAEAGKSVAESASVPLTVDFSNVASEDQALVPTQMRGDKATVREGIEALRCDSDASAVIEKFEGYLSARGKTIESLPDTESVLLEMGDWLKHLQVELGKEPKGLLRASAKAEDLFWTLAGGKEALFELRDACGMTRQKPEVLPPGVLFFVEEPWDGGKSGPAWCQPAWAEKDLWYRTLRGEVVETKSREDGRPSCGDDWDAEGLTEDEVESVIAALGEDSRHF